MPFLFPTTYSTSSWSNKLFTFILLLSHILAISLLTLWSHTNSHDNQSKSQPPRMLFQPSPVCYIKGKQLVECARVRVVYPVVVLCVTCYSRRALSWRAAVWTRSSVEFPSCSCHLDIFFSLLLALSEWHNQISRRLLLLNHMHHIVYLFFQVHLAFWSDTRAVAVPWYMACWPASMSPVSWPWLCRAVSWTTSFIIILRKLYSKTKLNKPSWITWQLESQIRRAIISSWWIAKMTKQRKFTI